MGGIGEAVMKMCIGNGFGFAFADTIALPTLFGYQYGAFLLEVTEDVSDGIVIGTVLDEAVYTYRTETVSAKVLQEQYDLLSAELVTTSQRVNLFEKVKIPECRENIRKIGIFLGDMNTSAVARCKIAKQKAEERAS
jgi:vacuolar-type H+-ATPase subunit D/Vma8